ncbi:MltA domain-containing protein [Sphingomonas donggukensis]|uniref:peptidoglycan lytic exotransglycosylase n=1 Tax=Sphingomonas donggukensis TaxID=2949093 RepID=A0ABY4U0T2_9SPHN|nr:MltA domain-containing protein [Sphingomonas donggukensis]URW76168.1 MltA domain-containing protein [Sphingomonas donggukensis]
MTMRLMTIVATAVVLSACSGRIVPPTVGTGVPAASDRPATSAVHPSTNVAVRRPTAATPIAPIATAPTPAGVTTAAAAGVLAGPPVASLPMTREDAAVALAAFRTSCPGLTKRADVSGLTRPADWQPACDAARATGDGGAPAFFARWLEAVQIGDGKAFATGYYEPEIAGSRTRGGAYQTPIYARPRDLVEVDLGLFATDLKGKKIRGKVSGNSFVPYDDRTAIEQGALDGRAPVLAWAADPVEIFFLQIQGSGRLRLPDGNVMRIGYDTQNGREYTGIGALMRQRGLLQPGQTSMQGLMGYLRANPEEGRAIMRENKSFVFFRELTGAGPLGAMGYPVTGGGTVAVDVKFVPLGAPVLLSMDRADANGIWVAQDTGGAIKGANRFDTFWGAGDDARAIAGGMAARGTAFLLLPIGTAARLTSGAAYGGPATKP